MTPIIPLLARIDHHQYNQWLGYFQTPNQLFLSGVSAFEFLFLSSLHGVPAFQFGQRSSSLIPANAL